MSASAALGVSSGRMRSMWAFVVVSTTTVPMGFMSALGCDGCAHCAHKLRGVRNLERSKLHDYEAFEMRKFESSKFD